MKTVAFLCTLLCALCVEAADEPFAPRQPVTRHSSPVTGESGFAASPYGVCSHLTWQEFPARKKTFALCSVADIGIVRCDFPWPDHERKRGEWDFTKTDTIVADAKAAGIAILPIFHYWHGGYPRDFCDLGPWSRHMKRAAAHYAEDISVYEIWNEQNLFQQDHVGNPTNYAAVLKAGAEAIRECAPGTRVAIGGFSGVPLSYIEELYKLGAGAFFDIMNVHPYCFPDRPEGHLDRQLEDLRALMAKYGDAGKPIWITEFGSPTNERKPDMDTGEGYKWEYDTGVDEATAARYLSRALGIAFAEGVETFFHYELRDREHERYNREAFFGLCRNDFTPKPAFSAYAAFTSMRPTGSVQKTDRSWHDEGRTLFFPQWRRPDDADALRETDVRGPLGADAGMAWALGGRGPMRVRFTSSAMRFFDHLGKEIWPVAAGDGAYELDVSENPIYFVGGELRL